MYYVQYIRVSTKRQGDSGLGLESQKEILNHYIDGRTAETFIEVQSGGDNERPELQKAIEYALENDCGLAVAKLDRLSRNTEFALEVFNQLGGYIYSCDIPQELGTRMDKFTLTIMLAIADRERELVKIRTKAAMQKKLQRDGKWQKPNLEYKAGNVGRKGAEAHHHKAKKRGNNRKVYETIKMYREKKFSWSDIARCLNNSGFSTAYDGRQMNGRTKRTKGFQAVQVQRIYEKYET